MDALLVALCTECRSNYTWLIIFNFTEVIFHIFQQESDDAVITVLRYGTACDCCGVIKH